MNGFIRSFHVIGVATLILFFPWSAGAQSETDTDLKKAQACAEKKSALQKTELEIEKIVAQGEQISESLDYGHQQRLDPLLQTMTEAQIGYLEKIPDEFLKNCGVDPQKPDTDKVMACLMREQDAIKKVNAHFEEELTQLVAADKQRRSELFVLREILVTLGCEVPKSEFALPHFSEKTLLYVKESEGKKIEAPTLSKSHSGSSAEIFVGQWTGKGQFLKSSSPELVGVTQDFIFEIYAEGGLLGVKMQNNTMCAPGQCQTKIAQDRLTIDYIGPPHNALATAADAQVTFHFEGSVKDNQLTGQVFSHATTFVAGHPGKAEFLLSLSLHK